MNVLDYLEGNTVDNSTRISANEDAIKALKGQVGTTVTNVENTINAKIEANNTVIRNDISTAINNNNTIINKILQMLLAKTTQQSLTKLTKNIDAKIANNNTEINKNYQQ